MWVGGAEVVGLTHVLKRPVHVYELVSTGRRWVGIASIHMWSLPVHIVTVIHFDNNGDV